MGDRRVVIVGAGIAGLSAGLYARMNGYPATILEMNHVPGGLCAAWKRKGYTFDLSMHMFTGSREGPFHRMWQELGVMDGLQFVRHDEATRIEGLGRTLSFGRDRQRLEQDMLALSPGDAKPIRELVDLLFGPPLMGLMNMDAPGQARPLDLLRLAAGALPFLPVMARCGRTTVQEFAARFRDPFLRTAVRFLIDSPGWPMERFPLVALCGMLSGMDNLGVPVGGSHPVMLGMARRFQEAGGELRLRTRVEGLLLEGDRVAGVRLADGAEERADTVVWAADGRTLVFDLLGGRYTDEGIRRMYETWTPVQPLVHVALGVARDMTAEPHMLSLELEEPVEIAGEPRRWVGVLHHAFDPTMAPGGKAVVEAWWPTRAAWWQALRADLPRYRDEKQRVADRTLAALDRRWPGLSAQVEVCDVPTPATYARYTGNWQASPDGWYITPDNMRESPRLSLPGLAGLHMAGQWTAPFTGTPIAALTGRQVVQTMCRRDGRPFRTG